MSERTSPGRRAAGRTETSRPRISPLVAVALAAVLVTALGLAGMKGSDHADPDPVREARYRPLDTQTLVCPASLGGDSPLAVGSLTEEGEGTLSAGPAAGGELAEITVEPGAVADVAVGQAPTVIVGDGSSALGLVGARTRTDGPAAAAECVTPQAETWFTGAGAGGTHTSTLLLVNPDAGPAVADVTVWSSTGIADAPNIRGLTVPGGTSLALDLSELVPTREELTLRVSVARGRLAASMRDRYTPRGGSARVDSLQAGQAPATDLLVPGFPRESAEATLVLANPGENASRVTLRVVGAETEFRPEGFDEIRVGAGQVVVQELPEEVTELVADEDTTLRLVASEPVTAGVRVAVGRDFAHLPAVAPVSGDAVAVVPVEGGRSLVLNTTGDASVVQVEFIGARDATKAEAEARLRPATTTSLAVPAGTRAVVVRSTASLVGAVRTIGPSGISWVPLRPLLTEKVIPDVRPDW